MPRDRVQLTRCRANGQRYVRMPGRLALAFLIASVLIELAADAPRMRPPEGTERGPVSREERHIQIGGLEELWRLEWRTPPVPACQAGNPLWFTCPCIGFAFGEAGDLDLVRLQSGLEVDRLPLSPLFGTDLPETAHKAVLRRWDVHEKDHEDPEANDLAARVRKRPLSAVMKLADYDHDGLAAEFVLQVGNAPCGKRIGVLVGVSRRDDRMHVFRSAGRPDEPLHLRLDHWEALRGARGRIKRVDWACADHGSDSETEVELRADDGVIEVTTREFACDEAGHRGRLLAEHPS